jgi:hypothetical protein
MILTGFDSDVEQSRTTGFKDLVADDPKRYSLVYVTLPLHMRTFNGLLLIGARTDPDGVGPWTPEVESGINSAPCLLLDTLDKTEQSSLAHKNNHCTILQPFDISLWLSNL